MKLRLFGQLWLLRLSTDELKDLEEFLLVAARSDHPFTTREAAFLEKLRERIGEVLG